MHLRSCLNSAKFRASSNLGDDRQLESPAVLAADVLVGLVVVERLGLVVESQFLARAPGDVSGVAHSGTDVPGVDLLVQRFAVAAVHRVEEIASMSLLGYVAVAFTLLGGVAFGADLDLALLQSGRVLGQHFGIEDESAGGEDDSALGGFEDAMPFEEDEGEPRYRLALERVSAEPEAFEAQVRGILSESSPAP